MLIQRDEFSFRFCRVLVAGVRIQGMKTVIDFCAGQVAAMLGIISTSIPLHP